MGTWQKLWRGIVTAHHFSRKLSGDARQQNADGELALKLRTEQVGKASVTKNRFCDGLTAVSYTHLDHCVPADQKEYLIDALEKNGVSYDYVEFPHSNHLLYGDLDKMQTFMDLSLEYCEKYFQ